MSDISATTLPSEENRTHVSESKEQRAMSSEPLEEKSSPPAGSLAASKTSVHNTNAVPDGGLTAWLQVLGGFFLLFNSWGLVNTFGVYQTYYESGQLFRESSSNIAWIGAVQACLLMFVGALIGPIYDAGRFRHLIITGSFLVVFGHMMLSLVHAYWQALLAQAFCVGIGCGLLFVPGVAIISTYFTTKLSLATGIVASGSGFGGIVYPIVFHRLQQRIGFGWATRVIGFIALGTLLISISVMKMRVKPPAIRKFVDFSALTEAPFAIYCLAAPIGFCGLFVPYFFIQYFAIASGATNTDLGFYTLAILNAASVFGRVVPNYFADKVGPLNIMIIFSAMSGMLILLFIVGASLPGVICLAIFFGFFSGTFVSMPPSILVSLTKNRALIGTRLGMAFTFTSVGLLIGTPISGAILGNSSTVGVMPSYNELNFDGTWVFGGVLVLASSFLFACCRFAKTGLQLMVKA